MNTETIFDELSRLWACVLTNVTALSAENRELSRCELLCAFARFSAYCKRLIVSVRLFRNADEGQKVAC